MRKTTRKDLEEMNIQEIEEYGLLKEYEKELQGMKTDSISRRVVDELYGESIMDIAYAIDEEKLNNTSISLFPNPTTSIRYTLNLSFKLFAIGRIVSKSVSHPCKRTTGFPSPKTS